MTRSFEVDRLAVLVHEVRSPAAALAALAEALGSRPAELEDLREVAELALAACRSIERVVLDASVASVRAERIDVAALVRQAAASARVRGVRVDVSIGPALPAVAGDSVRLRQALDNLLENAVAWSPQGATVVVGARAAGPEVELYVTDRGPGIPTGERERVFEHGTRLDPARPGSGIGLALVRAIAEAHGGSARLDTRSGVGSTFTIRLPASNVEV